MGIGFNSNDYGITRKEFKQFKNEMQLKDLQNDKIELTKQDYKEVKEHIKNGDLGKYLDNVSEEMRNAMGLSLKGKVDNSPIRTVHTTKEGPKTQMAPGRFGVKPMGNFTVQAIKVLPADVDRAKVLKHIEAADEARIEEMIMAPFKSMMEGIEKGATEARIEKSFNESAFINILDKLNEKNIQPASNENN